MKGHFFNFAAILLLVLAATYFWSLQLTRNPFPQRPEKAVVTAVLFNGDKEDGGWNEAHYQGFEEVRRSMKVKMIYREHVPDMDDSALAVIDELVQKDKAEIVFATSFNYGPALLQAARKYPNVKFFHSAGDKTADNLAVYFGRMYQARYLTGIAAGKKTQTGHIGYVAAFPIPEVIRGINAFTLGVRSVNPQAVVHVQWSGTWNDSSKEMQTANRLMDSWPIDVLAQHQNTTYPMQAAQQRGVFVIGYNLDRRAEFSDVFLTAPIWNWGAFYRARLQECFEGRFRGRAYFDGYGKDVFDIAPLSRLAAPGTEELIDAARERIQRGTWDVFYGPIYDQQGRLRIPAGENISDKELLESFDWFVEGVEGSSQMPK